MNHFELAARNLRRRPARSLLTIIGVAVAVGSFITLYGLSGSVYRNLQQSVEEHGADLTVKRTGSGELFGGSIPESFVPKVVVVPGVETAAGELLALVESDGGDHVLAAGWAPDSFFWDNVPLEAGRLPGKGERHVALLGTDLARSLNKHVGDDLTLVGERFKVIGITRFNSIINRNVVVVPLIDLQDATFRPGALTFISVKVRNASEPGAVDKVASGIEALGGLTASKSESVLRNDSSIGLLRAVSSAMAWIALLMGVLMVLNTLLMAVLERTREIGILSAIGWSTRRIMAAMIVEGFILSALGSALGIVLGILGSRLLSMAPAIGRYVAISLTPGLILATAAAAMLLGVVGSSYPAWRAARQSPAEALGRG